MAKRTLLALTALVLGAHAVLLRASPSVVQPAETAPVKVLVVHSVPVAATSPPPLETAIESTRTALPAESIFPAKQTRGAPQRLQQRTPPTAAARIQPRTEAAVASVAAAEPAQVVALAAAAAPAPPTSANSPAAFLVPDSMRLRYKVDVRVHGIALRGEGLLVWQRDSDSYEARLEISSPISPTRTQRSTGRITPEGLAPTRFSDKGRNEEAAHFERDKGKVSFSSNRPDAPLLAGAQDRLSVILQLAAMIGGAPAKFPAGSSISIQTAGTHDAEPWVFTVEGTEELDLPGGRLGAIKLTRNARKEFDQKVELWLAPGMAYTPVRLRLTQPNGDWVDQQWSSTDKG